jgi:hypothetical protein
MKNAMKYQRTQFSFLGSFAILLGSSSSILPMELSAPPPPPEYVARHWESEFASMEHQIEAKRGLYERDEDPYPNERILDRHSCILPEDRTPFDVEYRRTHALIDLLETRHAVRSSPTCERGYPTWARVSATASPHPAVPRANRQ